MLHRIFTEYIFSLLESVLLSKWVNMYFKHDKVPPHSTHQLTNSLNEYFTGKWIGLGSFVNWLPWYLNITQLHYWWTGWMKRELYKLKFNTQNEITAIILNAAVLINKSEIVLRQDHWKWPLKCINLNGGILDHLLEVNEDYCIVFYFQHYLQGKSTYKLFVAWLLIILIFFIFFTFCFYLKLIYLLLWY